MFPALSLEHVAIIGTLVLLEGLLSADNAVVLAVNVRHLSPRLRQRALLYGMGGAVVLRMLGILFARRIIGLWWLSALGAGYLLFLCLRHFFGGHSAEKEDQPEEGEKPSNERSERVCASFWRTVIMVELTDIAFALDSILVAVAVTNNLTAIALGALIGILLLRIAAGYISRLIERYPSLDNLGYALVGWAGIKLAAKSLHHFWIGTGRYTHETAPNILPEWIFWLVMAAIIAIGIWEARRREGANAAEPVSAPPPLTSDGRYRPQ